MRTKLLAALVAGGCLVGLTASAFAQASAYPQTGTLEDFGYREAVPSWNNRVTPGAPRLFNQVPAQQLNGVRHYHRGASAEHTSNTR